jgi:hypothetical protein
MRFNVPRTILALLLCLLVNIFMTHLICSKNNLAKYAKGLESRFEISVFLKNSEKAPEVLAEKIRAFDRIREVRVFSRESARERMGKFRNEITLAEGNPFPDSLIIRPARADAATLDSIMSELKKYDSIDETRYDENLLKIITILRGLERYYLLAFRIACCCVYAVFAAALFLYLYFSGTSALKDANLYFHLIAGILAPILFALSLYLAGMVLKGKAEHLNITLSFTAWQIFLLVSCSMLASVISLLLGNAWGKKHSIERA